MTSEVAILNREAVAIAADSAVTVDRPEGRKIYNTANKLFALSQTDPVAVMIYNAVSFGPIPWETIVKEYRRRLALKTYNTIEEYASDFVDHLSSLVQYVSAEEQRTRVMQTIRLELSTLQVVVQQIVDRAALDGQPFKEDQIRSLILRYIENRIDELNRGVFVEGLSASIVGRYINTIYKDWGDFVDQSLSGLPTNERIKRLARVMARTSLRVPSPSPWCSGVVVVGFGRNQWFPALSHYLIDGVIAEKVRSCRANSVEIGDQQPMGIYPFAQTDMVATFMDGISPEYVGLTGFVEEQIDWIIQHFSNQVKGALSPNTYINFMNQMEQSKSNAVGEFTDYLGERKKSNYKPITIVVESLPKEGLAEMAEALVSLTSLKRRVSLEGSLAAETVGGPIDVAVISKGDGLVWIKRKQYFSPNLNHRYFYRDRQTIDDTREEQP